MTLDEAIKEWKYKKNTKERLKEICLAASKRYVLDGKIEIASKANPIYIPDKNYKSQGAVYAQLLKACVKRQEVIPESLGISVCEMNDYLEQLASKGLLVFSDKKKKANLCYIPTTKGEEWLSWRNKVKRLIEIISPIIPNVEIHVPSQG